VLDERTVDPDPLRQFAAWFDEARAAGVACPEIMTLATAAADGSPSARMVLLKGAGEHGFTFFTSTESRKGRELEENPRAALVLYWRELGRQVRVEGRVEPVGEEESRAYFDTRPRASRLSAWASPQSEPVESRAALERRFAQAAARFPEAEIPLPPHWGGYRVVPETVELWEHRENRLHDRVRYTRTESGWWCERLAP
jgi:pyridoxamine 5'-phosphate oxidase